MILLIQRTRFLRSTLITKIVSTSLYGRPLNILFLMVFPLPSLLEPFKTATFVERIGEEVLLTTAPCTARTLSDFAIEHGLKVFAHDSEFGPYVERIVHSGRIEGMVLLAWWSRELSG
jgi:hypothetical protein